MRFTYVSRALLNADESVGLAEGGLHYAAYGPGARDATPEQKKAHGEAFQLVEQARELLNQARAILRQPDAELPFYDETPEEHPRPASGPVIRVTKVHGGTRREVIG